MSGQHQTFLRAWTLLAVAAIVGSLLVIGAANPERVLGAPGGNTSEFQVTVSGSVTAGTPFTVTVTAKDSKGKTVPSYPGGATLTGLAAAPNGQAATHGLLTVWDNGVSSATVIARKSQEDAQLIATDTIDGVTVTGTATFDVAPSIATSLAFADGANTFNGQPVDTESNTEIASSLSADFVPVKVIARDTFGNRVGGVQVTLSSSPETTDPADDLQGTKTVATNNTDAFGTSAYGEAAFIDLKITKFGNYTLSASAAGAASATSGSFEIVADLAKCTGTSCKSTGRSAGTNLQITYSSLSGVASFNDVTLTTSFIGDATESGCTGSAAAFGQLTETRVQGSGIAASEPDFKFAMIVPKATLQNLGLTSRAADTYNVCLGVTRLDGGTTGWTGRETLDGPLVTITDPDHDGVYWGFVADCGTVDAGSPCVSLKTKNAGQVQAELGLSKSEMKALGFVSSDLAVVINKPYPWDGKGGLF
jgi:hypothetical protein